jgi:ATP-binding cassette subfamily B (MDR/TAP) protein 9
MGDVFSCLSAAVGAADKVVEMIKRVPRMPPSGALAPANFSGRVELRDVGAPARPLPARSSKAAPCVLRRPRLPLSH